MRTPNQRARQHHRDESGRYAEVNPCYRCGYSAGIDYISDKRTDSIVTLRDGTIFSVADRALCLCGRCASFLDRLDDDAFAAEVTRPGYGKKGNVR